ncbi:hypothetical protein Tco_0193888 [Tanacetum coccineum]
MELVQGATPICEGSCRLTSLERQEVWNDCMSCKVRVGSNGNLWWEAFVLLGRKKEAEQRGGYLDVKESKGNEPILALPEGAEDFVVYYDARRARDLEACLEKWRREGNCLYVAKMKVLMKGLHGLSGRFCL